MRGQRQVYIVVSQTGTMLSTLLKLVTGAKYNHVSISLRSDLEVMYSFGRLNPYNPFIGGFVEESPYWGTFRRFRDTEAAVLCLDVTSAQYEAIGDHLAAMYARRAEYHYNYLGLFLAAFRIRLKLRNRYYCSEFVKELLTQFQVIREGETDPITQPIQFLYLKNCRIIYQGKLRHY